MSVGSTVVAVSVNDVALGAVALRDKLAPFARACVAQMEMSGVQVGRTSADEIQHSTRFDMYSSVELYN
jgi:cation transport ATPase